MSFCAQIHQTTETALSPARSTFFLTSSAKLISTSKSRRIKVHRDSQSLFPNLDTSFLLLFSSSSSNFHESSEIIIPDAERGAASQTHSVALSTRRENRCSNRFCCILRRGPPFCVDKGERGEEGKEKTK